MIGRKNMINFSPMKNKQDTPKVGVGVILLCEDRILLMKRKGSHCSGKWGLPGGHLEIGEDFYTCCKREAKEEICVKIKEVEPYCFENVIFVDEGLHYVTLFFKATKWNGTPHIIEKDKCSEIRWIDINNVNVPVMGALDKVFNKLSRENKNDR